MRILLVNNHYISDPTAGVTRSLLTIMQWLAEAGHDCRILTTARVEGRVPLAEHHLRDASVAAGVQTTLLATRHHNEARPDRAESAQYLAVAEGLLDEFRPEQVLVSNAHQMVLQAMRLARQRGIATAFALRGYGYTRRLLQDADRCFTCSRFLSDHYRRLGIESTPLTPPFDWASIVAPEAGRRYVTFVHPGAHKGRELFLLLANMLWRRRPDIPLLVVESGRPLGVSLPNVETMAPVARPAEYFARTRILLVPSAWDEPFGRVAAEALINGIPAIVSDRGALPEVVGAVGTVRPADDAEAWLAAVCGLWDDPSAYGRASALSWARGQACYGEGSLRRQHLDYFERPPNLARSSA